MNILQLFGKVHIIPNTIYEVLISTRNGEGMRDPKHPYNIAPMGIEFLDDKLFYLKPYKTTQTYRNLSNEPFFGLNISYDVQIFYDSVFSKEKITKNLFLLDKKTETPYLKDTIASMICKTISEEPLSDERVQFECELLSLTSWNEFFEPPCRARNLIFESLIHYTRLEVFKDPIKRDFLVKQIFEYQEIIKRTSKNSIYDKIISDIIKKVKNV